MDVPEARLQEYCQDNQISLLLLFGSTARGLSNKNSDIDLAVSFKNGYPGFETMARLESEFASIIKRERTESQPDTAEILEIDLVLIERASPLLKYNISQEGYLIYESEPGLYADFVVRAMKEHQDARKFYRFAKENIENFLKSEKRGRVSNARKRVSPPKID